MKPSLEVLEDRLAPATLDVVGGALTYVDSGAQNNTNLTVSVGTGASAGYSFNDTASTITLGSGAISAGWRGNGTNTVTGLASTVGSIQIDAGLGTNTVNLRSLAVPTTVIGGSGTTAVNISSTAPTNNGNLSGIAADVTINAGANTSLWVADVTATSGHSDVRVNAGSVTGLGPRTFSWSGTLASLRVSGSASATLAESFTVTSPDALYFRLDCNNGPDSVTVAGDVSGDCYLGGGDDTLTVLAGFTLTGNVHTGGQAGDQVFYGAPDYGTITGTVGP